MLLITSLRYAWCSSSVLLCIVRLSEAQYLATIVLMGASSSPLNSPLHVLNRKLTSGFCTERGRPRARNCEGGAKEETGTH